jgi:LuxR family quorum-sensing system transcriptional regulator CciR
MGVRIAFEQFLTFVAAATSPADLADVVGETARRMGYDYYALTHHVDLHGASPSEIRLHNYPDRWVEYFDRNGLATSDPIHRASQRTAAGFTWRHVPQMIPLTPGDRRILALAADHGIGEGLTVPANIPGEVTGSCSFATAAGKPIPVANFAVTQVVGVFAFERARWIWQLRPVKPGARPRLTDRQRDCLIWGPRGKGDWEISRILGISEETVAQHIRQACERYGVQKRTSLIIHALLKLPFSCDDVFSKTVLGITSPF